MAEMKGGITVHGGSVDSMPVILDGRTSLYTEAIDRGLIEPDTTYEQFLERLAVKPGELSKVVKAAVAENLEKTVNTAVATAIGNLGLGQTYQTAPNPTDLSDEALNQIHQILGVNP